MELSVGGTQAIPLVGNGLYRLMGRLQGYPDLLRIYGRKITGKMAKNEQPRTEPQGPADWTGLIIAALAAPAFFIFVYLGKAELGFTVSLVLCVVLIAIKLRWRLRRHTWFWGTIALVIALHIPLLFIIRWPQTKIPTIAFSMPFGIADFLLISGAISLAEKVFSKGHSSDEQDG